MTKEDDGDPLWGLPTGGTFAVDHAAERRERLEQLKAYIADDPSTHMREPFRREYLGQWFFVGEENAEKADLHGDRPGDVPAHPEVARDSDGEGCGDAQVEPEADADKATE